ncbi:MAG: hypothetical protein CL916_11495 [Deltaproteobacteria bacterium]|nr:hypothetical protein [Deltaproteobacteria bacterium]
MYNWFYTLFLFACSSKNTDSSEIIPDVYDGPRQLDFLILDNGRMNLHRIDEIGTQSWSVSVGSKPRDLVLLPQNRVLVSNQNGATIHDLSDGDETLLFDDYENVQSVVPMDSGYALFSQQENSVLVHIHTSDGIVHDSITLSGYRDLRLARIISGSTSSDLIFRFTASEPYRIVEVTADGNEIRSIPLDGKGYNVEEMEDGSLLATTGDDACLDQIDGDGNEIHTWGCESAHPDIGLDWSSGFSRSDDTHMVVSNWLGHSNWGNGPHVVEYDMNNNVTWNWADHEMAMQITNVLVLDARGQ